MSTLNDMITQTLPVRMADQLRADIMSERIAPGSRLTAKEIADIWHTSQVPVREAFSILAGEGLLEITAYRGATVIGLNEDRINEINDIVGACEILLCKKCMKRGFSEDLLQELFTINKELEDLTEKISDTNQLRIERVTLNMRFHRTMYSVCEGTETFRLYIRYAKYLEAVRHVYAMPKDRILETVHEHYKLIDAAREGDVEKLVCEIRVHSMNSRVRFGLYQGNVI